MRFVILISFMLNCIPHHLKKEFAFPTYHIKVSPTYHIKFFLLALNYLCPLLLAQNKLQAMIILDVMLCQQEDCEAGYSQEILCSAVNAAYHARSMILHRRAQPQSRGTCLDHQSQLVTSLQPLHPHPLLLLLQHCNTHGAEPTHIKGPPAAKHLGPPTQHPNSHSAPALSPCLPGSFSFSLCLPIRSTASEYQSHHPKHAQLLSQWRR